jgi:phosphohistidine phosphatase
MKLYLVQHGEACQKEVDSERPLTARGREDIERLANSLGRAGVEVARVVHSGKLRAAQTADILAAVVAPYVELETSDHLHPNDDPRSIDWANEAGGKDTMLVGHLPFMARLVSLLVAADADRPIVAYHPGSVVCLESGSEGDWQISWMIRPALL